MDIFTASARPAVLAAVVAAALLVPAAPAAASTVVCVPATQICVDDGGVSDDAIDDATELVDETYDTAIGVAGTVLAVPGTAVDTARDTPDVCVTTVCVRGTGATVAQYDDALCDREIHPNVRTNPWDLVRHCP